MYGLYHYGIKGMRWGVRRYQNKDGTLTAAGKRRYSDSFSGSVSEDLFKPSIKSGKDKSPVSPAEKIAKETERVFGETGKITRTVSNLKKKKNKIELSDEELKAAIERMRLEEAYEDLSNRRINKGKNTVNEILSIAGSVAAIASSAAGIATAIYTLRKKAG